MLVALKRAVLKPSKWFIYKVRKRQLLKRPHQRERRKSDVQSEKNLSQSMFTRYWSKCTPTLVFHQKPCPLWTRLFRISLSVLPTKQLDLPSTTSDRQVHPERFKLWCDFYFQGNWQNMPFPKEPRQSPNTLLPSKAVYNIKGPFQGHHFYTHLLVIGYKCIAQKSVRKKECLVASRLVPIFSSLTHFLFSVGIYSVTNLSQIQ